MKKIHWKINKRFVANLITYALVTAAYIICQTMMNEGMMSRSLKGQMIPICVYIVMAVSLNLTVGISGELSLGHAGFMSVGAFSGIIMSSWLLSAFDMQNTVLRLILALACLFCLAVPVLGGLSGDGRWPLMLAAGAQTSQAPQGEPLSC